MSINKDCNVSPRLPSNQSVPHLGAQSPAVVNSCLRGFFWLHPNGPWCFLSRDVTPTCNDMGQVRRVTAVWAWEASVKHLLLPMPE